MPIRSGITRWSIWPSVSSVFSSSRRALEAVPSAFRQLDPLAELEGVVVGDDDLGPLDVVEHVAGNEFAAGVVAVGIVGLENAQPVLDRMPGATTRKPRVKVLAARAPHGVDRLPGDQHRHHGGLAGAGGELQREPHQLRVGVRVRRSQVVQEDACPACRLRRDLGQPDRGLDRLDLAEEGPDAAELVMPPVLKQPGGFRRHLPLIRVGQAAATGRRVGGPR